MSNFNIDNFLNLGICDKDGLILSNDIKHLSGIIKIRGIDTLFNDDDTNFNLVQTFNNFISNANNLSKFRINHYHIRSKIKENIELESSLFNKTFSKDLFNTYTKGLGNTSYDSNYYLFITTQIKSESTFDKERDDFKRLLETFIIQLQTYQAKILNTYENNGICYSEVLEFFDLLLTGESVPQPHSFTPISEYIANIDYQFTGATGLLKKNYSLRPNECKYKFFRMIEIKDRPDFFIPCLLSNLLGIDASFVIQQYFEPQTKAQALNSIKNKWRQQLAIESNSENTFSQIYDLQAQVEEDKACLGKYYMTVKIFADTEEELDEKTNILITMISNRQFKIGVLNTGLFSYFTSAFLAQIPLSEKFIPHKDSNFTSECFCTLSVFDNNLKGKKDGLPWGKAVIPFIAETKNFYYLNFHKEDYHHNQFGKAELGHSLVLGASGSGKTVLLNFMLNMCTKYMNPTTFKMGNIEVDNKAFSFVFFDKDYGGELNIKALNGNYFAIKVDEPTGLNPFICENTQENVNELLQLVKIMIEDENIKIDATMSALIEKGIQGVLSLDIDKRTYPITKLREHIPKSTDVNNDYLLRLNDWCYFNDDGRSGMYSWVFDNKNTDDRINVNSNAIIGIDGTNFLNNDDISSAISYHLLTKINKLIDGRRLILAFDECWSWLTDDRVKAYIYDKLKTMRKMNGIAILATQSPEEILSNSVGRTIVEQCSTKILLPNTNAIYSHYEVLGLTPLEFEQFKTLDPNSRKFMVKKSDSLVVLNGNLSMLKKYQLDMLSATPDNRKRVSRYIKQGYSTFEQWIKLYLKDKNYL